MDETESLYREEKTLLRAAIKAQREKLLGFRKESNCFVSAGVIRECIPDPDDPVSVSVSVPFDSVSFKVLIDNGYLETQGVMAPLYRVTDKGWNYFRGRRKRFWINVSRSFLIPLVVSVITTLITMFINGYFTKTF